MAKWLLNSMATVGIMINRRGRQRFLKKGKALNWHSRKYGLDAKFIKTVDGLSPYYSALKWKNKLASCPSREGLFSIQFKILHPSALPEGAEQLM